jgi:large subunit ribosomal protein L5
MTIQIHTALKEKYRDEVLGELKRDLSLKNPMAAPRITKVVVNMGTGDRLRNKELRQRLIDDMSALTGQTPKVQNAKLSVAGFGLREGQPVGLTSTLRKDRMYHFLDKLITVVLPRIRDFRGVSAKSFDKGGNYTLGLSEHTVFPEIDLAKVDRPHGLEITVVVKNSNPEKSKILLEKLGMPFVKEEE